MTQSKLRVLVVDDSALVRQALIELIENAPDLEVMASAADPFAAAERIRQEVPDVIILDVEMPRMDGITFLRKLMAQRPIPVIVCSTLVSDQSETMLAALEAGAVDVICKPQIGTRDFFEESSRQIGEVIRAAGRSRPRAGKRVPAPQPATAPPCAAPRSAGRRQPIVAIGASTGGTEALKTVLEAMPSDAPPILIVQHMPHAFTAAFAARLNTLCRISVGEARDGDNLNPGSALIAPGGSHMLLAPGGGGGFRVQLRDGPLVSRHKPSVDVLFRSVAQLAGPKSVGVIMTGMGGDGARGMKEMRDAGARTFGQNEATCVVYGMPQEAKKLGAVEMELPLDKLPTAILSCTSETAKARA
ncbi:MAG: chemotaxis response regulator protein-glutamate methylesterase [Pseudomonadota bacterium]